MDDPIAWRELDEFTQKQRSCRWIDTKHGQLLRISALRQWEEVRGRQHDLLAPGGVREWDKHTIPHLEIVNFLSHREDAPDAFAAKASGQGRQHAVLACDHQQVREVDRRVFHGDQHLVGKRIVRIGDLHQFQHVGWFAERRYLKSIHRLSPSFLPTVLTRGSTKNRGLDARTGASPVPTIYGFALLL